MRPQPPRRSTRPALALTLTLTALALLAAVVTLPLRGQTAASPAGLTPPTAPYHILGNLYYVGTGDVTSFLVVTPAGMILLDGGFVETAPLIRDSVARLGFDLRRVKILLNSHAHSDHAGGLAQLKAWTGARLLASRAEAPLLAAGGRGDFFFGDTKPFPPVVVDHLLADGEAVTLGGTTLVAHLTPGHTRGCTTWTMKLADGGRTYDVVFFGSASVLSGYRLVAPASYPGIAADYAHTFAVLAALPCDVFLGSHSSFFDGQTKADRLRAGAKPNPFIDPQGYRTFIAGAAAAFRKELAAQQAAPPPAAAPSNGAPPAAAPSNGAAPAAAPSNGTPPAAAPLNGTPPAAAAPPTVTPPAAAAPPTPRR
jgi:metallo-beta-lactamase class B